MPLPKYTFVPWLRRGLATEITEADRLGQLPETGTVGRPTLAVELTLDVAPAPGAAAPPRPSVTRNVQILGPGDVASLKREAILRTDPAEGVLGATPDSLAFIEFYDEDLPWRYTPARATSSRLRPWIALLVLTPEEFTLRERGRDQSPVLSFTDDARLPPAEETWAWAHVQLSKEVTDKAAVGTTILSDPDHARSRLLSPRRLIGDAQYHAFLVPAFEAGRLAGLGRPVDGVPAQKPSWGLPVHEADREMPVYHRFSFRTSTTGDFETLARQLVPRAVGDTFGSRLMDVSSPGFGVDDADGATVGLEGALGPPDFAPPKFPAKWSPAAKHVCAILDAGAEAMQPGASDPMIVPPAYGRLHAGRPRVVDARNSAHLAWLAELNLDFRSRAAAGLGSEIVRQRQEELMQRAWEQVGAVEEANKRLREAELARAAAQALMRKHIEPVKDDDRLTLLTAAAQDGLQAPEDLPTVAAANQPVQAGEVPHTASVRAAVDVSQVPAAAQSPAFRRLTRPQRPVMRRLGTDGRTDQFQGDLLSRMDTTTTPPLSVAPPPPDPEAGVELAKVQKAVGDAATMVAAQPLRPFEVFLELAADEVAAQAAANADFAAMAAADMVGPLEARVGQRYPQVSFTPVLPDPHTTERRVWDLVQAVTGIDADGPGRARLSLDEAAFRAEFSDDALGKAHGPVSVVRDGPPPPGATIGRTTCAADVQTFKTNLEDMGKNLAARADPPAAKELQTGRVADHVLAALDPSRTVVDRMKAAVPVIAGRSPNRALAPVQAHPEFTDPLFDSLCGLSQDHIVPNVSDLPRETVTAMEPNRRFIEAFLAGVNFAFNQELLWREYPTDQRGTSFQVFWDTRDAIDAPGRKEIERIHLWSGQLGAQAPSPIPVLVLVIRGELLERFPNTVIHAQRAAFAGGDPMAPRVLDSATPVRNPIFSARLEPDIRLVGFQLGVAEARGRRVAAPATADEPAKTVDPGWFFVFTERPGEPRFGLDAGDPVTPLASWDDLAWSALTGPEGSPFVHIAANQGLTPTQAVSAQWGRTAADHASIFLQSPVILARHASEMLKP